MPGRRFGLGEFTGAFRYIEAAKMKTEENVEIASVLSGLEIKNIQELGSRKSYCIATSGTKLNINSPRSDQADSPYSVMHITLTSEDNAQSSASLVNVADTQQGLFTISAHKRLDVVLSCNHDLLSQLYESVSENPDSTDYKVRFIVDSRLFDKASEPDDCADLDCELVALISENHAKTSEEQDSTEDNDEADSRDDLILDIKSEMHELVAKTTQEYGELQYQIEELKSYMVNTTKQDVPSAKSIRVLKGLVLLSIVLSVLALSLK